jgi:DNA polymerase-3 subunit delta'
MGFNDIQGHAPQIRRLKSRIQHDRLSGAYIFCGPEGIGKKMVASAFAQAVNCPQNSGEACGVCPSCMKIARGTHPDVHYIGTQGPDQTESGAGEGSRRKAPAESRGEIKIDDIRLLQQEISLRPYEAKYKVFIVDDAHMLNPEASNAFLKTLEEPPKNSVIILITDKPRLLFKTVVSRCWTIKFSALSPEEFMQALGERLALGDTALRYLALACEGRLGSALSQGASDVLAHKNRIIDYFTASPPNHSVENSFIQDRAQLKESLQVLVGLLRDIYVYKTGADVSRLVNSDRSELLKRLAGQISFARLDQVMQTIQESLLALEQNANIKLVLANVLSAVS